MFQVQDVVQQSPSGQLVSGASVKVTNTTGNPPVSTGVPATIYSDNGVTVISNSTVITNGQGEYSYWAPPGTILSEQAYVNNVAQGPPIIRTIPVTADAPASSLPATAVSFTQSGAGAMARTAQDKLRDVLSLKDDGAVGDNFTVDTARIQALFNDYAAAIQSLTPAAPSITIASAPILEIPQGRYVLGNLSFTGSVLRIRSEGAIFSFQPGSTGLAVIGPNVLDIDGVTFTGGANHLVVSNNNIDSTMFSLCQCSFHDSTDWPVIFKPVTPGGAFAVNHLSGIGIFDGCRWYNTNGCVKHYFDKLVVHGGAATLYDTTHAGGRWAANRSAFESRSLGDGIYLENFFGVALASNGNNGNVWVDNYPGDSGVMPVDNVNYIGMTSPVSGGGGVYIVGGRLGAEEGGVPVIRNWCHGLGGLSALGRVQLVIRDCGSQAGGNGGTTAALIILKKGLPNQITVDGGSGNVGNPFIDDSQLLDLSGLASNVAYWLNASRNGQGRISINIFGRNRALGGRQIVPVDLLPYTLCDLTETDPRTLAFGGLLNLLGGQVKFPAPQSPSTDPTTLDDYTEGTWTPTDASGAGLVLTVSGAEYIKIGQHVTVSGIITFPITANTANVLIGGLPYLSRNSSDWVYGGAPSFTNLGSMFSLLVPIANSQIALYDLTGVAKTNANFSGKSFRFSITYRTAA